MCLGTKSIKAYSFCLSKIEADSNCPPYVGKVSFSLPNHVWVSEEDTE